MPPPPPPPPPPGPRNTNLTGTWNQHVGSFVSHDYQFLESADGSFSVASTDPKVSGWRSASGKVAGQYVTIRFDNNVRDSGYLDNAYNNVRWNTGGVPPPSHECRDWKS